MSATEIMSPRNPLNAKLDAKSFAQLTVWVILVVGAWMLGRYLLDKGKEKALQLSGKASNTGSSNPFFG